MCDAETRYPTHEQELLAIIVALRTWKHYLMGLKFKVMTDHKSLQYFQTQPQLSGRQVRWKDTIANYDFDIEYIEGKTNVVADGLSRRHDHHTPNSSIVASTTLVVPHRLNATTSMLLDIHQSMEAVSAYQQLLKKSASSLRVDQPIASLSMWFNSTRQPIYCTQLTLML
jgi:hypothetical protein